jgi:membrane-bound metal-dependent hydrolase YbcI (DUF457 family)
MFAVGHIGLGYLVAKASQRLSKTEVNLPLIFLLSVIPDVDLLIPDQVHRGFTHSIVALSIVFIPFFVYYRKKSIPYFVAIAQHALVGDFLTNGGAEILWPLTSTAFGVGIGMKSWINISLEWAIFLVAIAILFRTNDSRRLLKPSGSSLLLLVPAGAIFVSAILGKAEGVPFSLLVPHLVFLVLFAFAIINAMLGFVRAFARHTKRV